MRDEEKKALEILQNKIKRINGYNIHIKDKPDLQSEDNSVGIEIVQSVREEDMKLRSLACEYWTNKANDNSRILRAMKKNGWNDNTIKDLDAGILYYKGDNNNGGYSLKIDLGLLKESVNKKLKKLNGKGYKIFKENQLFVFTEIAGTDEIFNMIMDELAVIQNDYHLCFTMIYICTVNMLYSFDYIKYEMIKYVLK